MYTVHVVYKKHRAQSSFNEAEAVHFAKAAFKGRHGVVRTRPTSVIVEVEFKSKPSKDALIKRLMDAPMPARVDWLMITASRGDKIVWEFHWHALTRVSTQ